MAILELTIYYVDQAGLKLIESYLPLPPEFWAYRSTPPCPATALILLSLCCGPYLVLVKNVGQTTQAKPGLVRPAAFIACTLSEQISHEAQATMPRNVEIQSSGQQSPLVVSCFDGLGEPEHLRGMFHCLLG